MPSNTKTCEKKVPLRDRALRESEASFRTLVEADPIAFPLCWGEQLLLRVADQELQGMKDHRGKLISGLSHRPLLLAI